VGESDTAHGMVGLMRTEMNLILLDIKFTNIFQLSLPRFMNVYTSFLEILHTHTHTHTHTHSHTHVCQFLNLYDMIYIIS
jgi:hypothetical protein